MAPRNYFEGSDAEKFSQSIDKDKADVLKIMAERGQAGVEEYQKETDARMNERDRDLGAAFDENAEFGSDALGMALERQYDRPFRTQDTQEERSRRGFQRYIDKLEAANIRYLEDIAGQIDPMARRIGEMDFGGGGGYGGGYGGGGGDGYEYGPEDEPALDPIVYDFGGNLDHTSALAIVQQGTSTDITPDSELFQTQEYADAMEKLQQWRDEGVPFEEARAMAMQGFEVLAETGAITPEEARVLGETAANQAAYQFNDGYFEQTTLESNSLFGAPRPQTTRYYVGAEETPAFLEGVRQEHGITWGGTPLESMVYGLAGYSKPVPEQTTDQFVSQYNESAVKDWVQEAKAKAREEAAAQGEILVNDPRMMSREDAIAQGLIPAPPKAMRPKINPSTQYAPEMAPWDPRSPNYKKPAPSAPKLDLSGIQQALAEALKRAQENAKRSGGGNTFQ